MTALTLRRAGLSHFTGTTTYYKHGIGSLFIYLTEGTKFLYDEAQCYWLADIVFSYQTHPTVRNENVQTWTLQKWKDDWLLTCGNADKKVLITQAIYYSDFPFDSIQRFFIDNILVLPSQY